MAKKISGYIKLQVPAGTSPRTDPGLKISGRTEGHHPFLPRGITPVSDAKRRPYLRMQKKARAAAGRVDKFAENCLTSLAITIAVQLHDRH